MSTVKKSITITSEQNNWLQSQLDTGNYASDSEIIREALREKSERAKDIELIRKKLIASEKSGFSKRSPKDIMEDTKNSLRLDVEI